MGLKHGAVYAIISLPVLFYFYSYGLLLKFNDDDDDDDDPTSVHLSAAVPTSREY